MNYELVVVADTNDADYITAINSIDEETLKVVEIVADAIKAKGHRHNWPAHEYSGDGTVAEMYPQLTEKQIEIFEDLAPYGENGIHTIKSIVYYPKPEKTVLL